MFRGYIGGAGAAILSGGRYNALCAKFGKDMPAGGFGIDVESVAESLQGARVRRRRPVGILYALR